MKAGTAATEGMAIGGAIGTAVGASLAAILAIGTTLAVPGLGPGGPVRILALRITPPVGQVPGAGAPAVEIELSAGARRARVEPARVLFRGPIPHQLLIPLHQILLQLLHHGFLARCICLQLRARQRFPYLALPFRHVPPP